MKVKDTTGSLGNRKVKTPKGIGFNSSLVRFRERRPLLETFEDRVSIPVWCDLEAFVYQIFQAQILFQFQSGAI